MDTIISIELLYCHICLMNLQPHPLYEKSGAKICPNHGDFFVYRERGKDDSVVFRGFDTPGQPFVNTKKSPIAKEPRRKKEPTTPRRYTISIRCDQTGDVYKSITEAARALGIGQPEISKNLQGYDLTVGGYTFSKLVDDGKGEVMAVPRPTLPRNVARYPLAIKCDQTGQVFSSIRKASEALGIPKTTIRYRLRRRLTYNVAGVYTFSKVVSQ